MTPDQLRVLLDEVQSGRRPVAEAHETLLATLRAEPLADLGFAKVDHHRATRQGFPEVVLGLGKAPQQIAAIAAAIAGRDHPLLVTRADEAAWEAVRVRLPEARYHEVARAITLPREVARGRGTIAIATAGTSDVPVAEEAAVTAELMGNDVDRLYDVGVAGIHRVLRERGRLEGARVIIVVAGMEGALPSVVAGMVAVPVIAVPTSIGYGASFGGIAALLGMLNSCANGVSVVNIDNGFGAGCIASMINHL
jgi:NCAIR mutase (PurE)-related protein